MAEPRPPGNNTITIKLPSEILFFQILPRLPVISLPNVMCVCKKWYLFIKSGAFATTYHHHVLTNNDHQNHHKHLVLSTTKRMFRSIDCETPQDGLTAARFLPFFLPFRATITTLTSLHGLVCVGTTEYEHACVYEDLMLWNPLTGDYKKLSKPNKKGCDHDHQEFYNTYEGIFGLYYISSDDDYRLLRVTGRDHVNIYIYSLKSNSWRKVESTQDIQQMASNWRTLRGSHHILLGEKLYFFEQVERGVGTFVQSYSFIRFDTKTEKFTEIGIPSFGNQMTNCLGFMVLKGCIHFCVAILIDDENYMANRRCYEMIELWRMDGDGDWTKVLTYGPMSFFVWGQSMLHLMSNGNLLLKNQGDVYVLDMKKHTKEMMFTYDNKDCEIPLTGKYNETIVSTKQYKVKKWFLTINGLELCKVRSWEEYNALERDMLEKYGEDIMEHEGDHDELWALCQAAGITGPSTNEFAMSSIDYLQFQLQVRALQIQLEMERKAREEMQDQIAKERKMERKAREQMVDQIAKERKMEQKSREAMQDQIVRERKAREDMQAQISELMSRCGNHFGTPPNPL